MTDPSAAQAPSPELIDSMCMRQNHGFSLLSNQQKEGLRSSMRQLYQEASGAGFYNRSDSLLSQLAARDITIAEKDKEITQRTSAIAEYLSILYSKNRLITSQAAEIEQLKEAVRRARRGMAKMHGLEVTGDRMPDDSERVDFGLEIAACDAVVPDGPSDGKWQLVTRGTVEDLHTQISELREQNRKLVQRQGNFEEGSEEDTDVFLARMEEGCRMQREMERAAASVPGLREEIERLRAALRGSYGAALLMQDVDQRKRTLIKELVAALNFVQEKCQLYGAADAARERIDAALARAKELEK